MRHVVILILAAAVLAGCNGTAPDSDSSSGTGISISGSARIGILSSKSAP